MFLTKLKKLFGGKCECAGKEEKKPGEKQEECGCCCHGHEAEKGCCEDKEHKEE